MNKAVGEENKQLVDSLKAYDFSFILSGERVDSSESMQVTLSNLGTKNTQNTLIYQMEEDGQVKKVDAVKTGSDAMQFMTKRLASYVILTYTTVSDIKGNDITTLYPAMITAAQTQIQSKENGNVPIEFWTRSKTPLVLKDKTGKKALEWTWSDIADIDLSLENDSQVWNGSRSYGKHIATSLKNGRVTAKDGKLYDSALWKNEGKAGKDTTITRIRGEFTITDKNRSRYAYTLKTITDSENIYAKDNMFVFVYPKDTELTDNNYMDYLAFWTGASADAGTFHERTAGMICIIDYGVGNLFSLKSSLAHLGLDAAVSADPADIRAADRLILPGVGAFGDAMAKLEATGLVPVIKEEAEKKPLLGICLGMQLLFEKSFEYGEHPGLGFVPGQVCPLAPDLGDKTLKVPQIGWNAVHILHDDPIFKYVRDGEYFYYVHSYYGKNCAANTLAVSDYSLPVTGVVKAGRAYGTQFHPEKSGDAGLRLLRAFSEL